MRYGFWRLLTGVVLLSMWVSAVPARAQDPPTPTPPPAAGYAPVEPGNYRAQINMAGLPREYRIHIPASYDPATPTALVVSLHPFGSSPAEQEAISGMSEKADEAGFVVAYPQALGDPPRWQFVGDDPTRQSLDLEFIRVMIRLLQERLNIDPARVYVTGFSNGGGLAHVLGCELSDMVAAIAPVAGTYVVPDDYICLPMRPVPVVAFHGTGDDTLPYDGIEDTLLPVRDWADGWAARNGCAETPAVAYEVGAITGETWGDCQDGADVTLYSIEGFGHFYPRTGQIPGTSFELPTADANATDLIWAFFEAHPMPRTIVAEVESGALTPGDYIGSVYSVGGKRWYVLHIPETYDPDVPTPLVINLHGRTSNPVEQALTSQMTPKADAAGFIVVYPEGAYPEGVGHPRGWSYWPARVTFGPADVTFIRDLIDDLANRLNIDPKRVYAAGFSAGGAMADRLGCDLSDRIAAVATVASVYDILAGVEFCDTARPVPVVAFHGAADETQPYLGLPDRLLSAPDWVARWAARNACDATPSVTLQDGVATGETWGNCRDGADVTLYTLEGFGHRWPRSRPIPGLEAASTVTDIDATDVIWDFFTAHPFPDAPSEAIAVPAERIYELQQQATEAAEPAFSPEPGDYTGDLVSGGLTREYILHIPPGYEHGAPTPLVIAFHGFGDNPVNFALASGFLDTADAAGFVLVFPAGSGSPRGWSARPDQESPDDVQFTRDLIDDLSGKISIDPARIYVTGLPPTGPGWPTAWAASWTTALPPSRRCLAGTPTRIRARRTARCR
ncbi:MAG: hypothetical protein M5R40_03120 [Anaerolineae bacterium]|nr:hypothetical protein [Anaerolineae bacterium]